MSKTKKFKLKFNMFPDWCYEQEQKDLDRRSSEGRHLVTPGQYFHKYEQDTTIQYRYQMDYQSIEPDPDRYKEIYAEQGWEYLGSARGWHYFRKPYDPMLPEESYEAFTDEESIAVLRKRWARATLGGTLASLLLFLIMAFSFFWFPAWLTLIPLLLLGIEFLYCFYSAFMIRHPEKQKGPKTSFYITLFYVLLFTLGFFSFIGVKAAHIQGDLGHIHVALYTVDGNAPACADFFRDLRRGEHRIAGNTACAGEVDVFGLGIDAECGDRLFKGQAQQHGGTHAEAAYRNEFHGLFVASCMVWFC